MLPKAHRLKRAQEINQIFKQGKGFHSPFFSVKYQENTQEGLRVAFSFGKKFLPRAVHRNRLKRVIISELQKVPDFFSHNIDLVFFLSSRMDIKDDKNIRENVENFLRKVYNRGKKNL